MGVTRVNSREFNQDVGRAKRAAANGPVIITDRGTPSHVLLTYEAYDRLVGPRPSLRALLHDPVSATIALEPGRMGDISHSDAFP
jgi:prevent-host-death family protein